MSRLADEVRKTFTSIHVSRNFRLFFAGQLISVSGTWINATATAVLVLHLTHSGVALGFMSALLFLPVLLFGVLGGTLADRFDKRRILLWSNAAYTVHAGAQFLLVATGVVEIWMVYTISLLNGLIYAIEPPTRQSFYVELVGEEHITNAVSLNSAVFTGTRVLGGAGAGAGPGGRAVRLRVEGAPGAAGRDVGGLPVLVQLQRRGAASCRPHLPGRPEGGWVAVRGDRPRGVPGGDRDGQPSAGPDDPAAGGVLDRVRRVPDDRGRDAGPAPGAGRDGADGVRLD